jgi:hypothetical protein
MMEAMLARETVGIIAGGGGRYAGILVPCAGGALELGGSHGGGGFGSSCRGILCG